jgi:hypothetical protein
MRVASGAREVRTHVVALAYCECSGGDRAARVKAA